MEEDSIPDDISPVIESLRNYLEELSESSEDRTLITEGKNKDAFITSRLIFICNG